MRKHLIDKTKKSNIKCEHCKFFINYNECVNTDSPKYGKGGVNYWNRCKQFMWEERKNNE